MSELSCRGTEARELELATTKRPARSASAKRGQGADRRRKMFRVQVSQLTQPIPEIRLVQYGRLREICGI